MHAVFEALAFLSNDLDMALAAIFLLIIFLVYILYSLNSAALEVVASGDG